jgi:hypothetical protein
MRLISGGISLLLSGLAFFPLQVQTQVQLLNVTKRADISETCVSVLNQQLTCSNALVSLGDATGGQPPFGIPLFLTSAQLTELCTSSCSNSLTNWQRRISGACTNNLRNDTYGGKFAMVAFSQSYIELYNSVCLKNKYALTDTIHAF